MRFILLAACILLNAPLFAQQPWPVIKRYDGNSLDKIAMPIGGIGTGNISIAGNGQWKDIEIMNRPAIGFYGAHSPKQAPFFMIFTQNEKGEKKIKTLTGPVAASSYAGPSGSEALNHGFPAFSKAGFDAAYPFATVNLEDDDMPVSAKAKVFNPFIPGDADASGIPIAVIRYEITNKTNKPLTVSVAGSLDNFIGMDGSVRKLNDWNGDYEYTGTKGNRNAFKKTSSLAGIFMTSDSLDKNSRAWGTIALTTPVSGDHKISHRTEFNTKGWGSNFTDLWNDFSDDGNFIDTSYAQKWDDPRAALSLNFTLAANETKTAEFFLTWNFPNRMDWDNKTIVGNYYSTQFADAWDVIEKTFPSLPSLEKKSLDFINLLAKSNYPNVVKEAALFNTSTLRTHTVFRAKDANFFAWEGVFNNAGSCYGNCSHVWNYEFASPFLFGQMAKKMRQLEYDYGLWDSSGLLSFRLSLPLKRNNNWKVAAADGQMGTVMKTYREWQLSGDDDFIKSVYPGVKRILSFAWIAGGWDADKDGVMEGCQHNTMDIEYYGPNPEIEFWYLGALKAAAEMARHMKDAPFEKTCRELFTKGSAWTDSHLFNGEYYIQKIQPAKSKDDIAAGLSAGMGAKDLSNPDFQIGDGCLVDQLVGQNMAHICGLGYLAKPANIKKALQSVVKYNYVPDFGKHLNNMRSYALANESGLMLTAYPVGTTKPDLPLSYAFEAWTGLEYTAATGMIYEGMNDIAIKTITDVRNRFDGIKRNPFNEEECGNHYARAMASWSAIIAISEFNYSAVSGKFAITAKPGNYFWSNGYAWGNAAVTEGKVAISVHHGKLKLAAVELKNGAAVHLKKSILLNEGENKEVVFTK